MEYRPLEITIIGAKDIKDVNVFSKMDVYVTVSIGGDPRTRQRSPVDKDGGKNPSWNFPMKFTIDEAAAQQNRSILIFQLKSERTLGDRDIGEVHVPVKELLDKPGDGKSNQFVSYQVRKPDGKPKGEFNFSYKFGDKVTAPAPAMGAHKGGDEPVTAYPAPVDTSAPYPPPGGYPPPGAYPSHAGHYPPPQTGYPPQPAMAGYGYPPQGGYPPPQHGYGYPPQGGYPPPQQGYGYPPVQQPPKKNKFGMGMGAGLLGGALGGLLIGDMVSDAADYDAGYDAGFDDGCGFDF